MRRSWPGPIALTFVLLCFAFAIAACGGSKVTVGNLAQSEAEQTLVRAAVVPMVAADSAPTASIPTGTPTSAPSNQSFTIHFIDVGQGDAMLVTVNGYRLLVDGGPSKERLRTRLQSLGITDIDAILVTNPDADHIRGLIEALAMFQVETSYASLSTNTTQVYGELQSAIATEPGIQKVTLTRGATIPVGGLQLQVLHPATVTGDRNDDSLVLRLSCGTVDVLLMGDATTSSEASMLAAGLIPDVEVVKAGHHGSRTSSGQAFIAAAKPEYVVFTAGLNSQYGHPHAEVVARFQAAGAQVISTDTSTGDDTQLMTSNCATYSFAMVGGGGIAAVATRTAATFTPAATRTDTPTVVAEFSVPVCYVAGQNSCNCSNFTTHAWAQWFHNTYDPADVNRLDADLDGVACESLP